MKKRSKLHDNEKGEYYQVQNTTSLRKTTTKMNETEMIEIPDLHSGIMFGNQQNEAKGSKVDPSASRLFSKSSGDKNLKPNLTEEIKATSEIHEEGSHLDSPKSHNEDPHKSKNSGNSKDSDLEDKLERKRLRDLVDKEYLKKRDEEDKKIEESHYYFRNLLIQGSFLQNLIWVDSYINPRHVRGILFFTYIVFNWYVWAVVFNNTKDPKKVPDFNRKTRDLTISEIWIAVFCPLGATCLIYIFCFIMKVSNERLKYTKTVRYLDYIISKYFIYDSYLVKN